VTPSFSVVIPVLDGAALLPEVLAAVRGQGRDVELLVIDSGSTDGSVELARAAGAEVLEIAPAEFGHGRTRNLGAERTSGELICFLTQDATPVPGWLDAYAEAFALAGDVGAAFGPHLPRPETSAMIARELTEFFAGFAPDGRPDVLGGEQAPYLSNVNACYRRACWAQVRFPDVPYSEDQAFARAMGAHGWRRAYHPGAAVLHAHDYSPVGFMRRYFDEYRGLRETSGHVERLGVRSTVRDVRGLVAGDQRWMREQGWPASRRAAVTGRSVLHHSSRKVFAALGSHAHRLPAPVQRTISLEGRTVAAPPREPLGPPPTTRFAARGGGYYQSVLELAREGEVPLLEPVPGMAEREHLHIAVVIPPFRRGSGGHSTIYNLLSRLEERGHTVSTWLWDAEGRAHHLWPGVLRHDLREYFRPVSGPAFKGFADWYGADVVLATGWDTVYPVLRLPNVRARAYLVQDHEPEFFATSTESVFAERTYGAGLYVIAASPWLRDFVHTRYGAVGSHFELGVDRSIYHPRPVSWRGDTLAVYTLLRFVFFGNEKPVETPFDYESLGVASPDQLAWAYSEATVGLSLSLTNYSLIPQEMLACGLPCVELAGHSIESVYGDAGPIELADANPVALADALDRLLTDEETWSRRSREGIAFVERFDWDRSADELERGLRDALRDAAAQATRIRTEMSRPLSGPTPPSWAESARAVPVERTRTREATDRLYARLSEADVAEVRGRLDPELGRQWDEAAPGERRTLALTLGAWYGVPGVLQKTGLRPDRPPEDVHSMARGPLSGGGSIYYADLVAECLRDVGASVSDVRRGLDFGSSSGRVVRALQAAFPESEWHGTDPNEPAIAWAREHLPEIEFRVSPQDPPLPYADGFFDLVVAISIWSHYGERAAVEWLREMHRVIRPGGYLLLSTHGLNSVSYYAQTGERAPAQLQQIRRALYQRGHWFAPEFGEDGDWGVAHPQWGTAFLTVEWLARVACPAWTIADFGVGQNAQNQDMYVLRREAVGEPE
jgi:O-antigen biosynthesis protein